MHLVTRVSGIMQFRHLKITEHCNKSPPPLFAHYFESEVGRRHLLKYSISLDHYAPTPLSHPTFPPHFPTMLHTRSTISCQHAVAFWKNRTLLVVYYRKSAAPCEPRGIEASCIASGDRDMMHVSLYHGQQNLGSGLQTRLVILTVCVN